MYGLSVYVENNTEDRPYMIRSILCFIYKKLKERKGEKENE